MQKVKSMSDIQAFMQAYASHPNYRAPRGEKLNAKSWQTEAPLRMLLNNLDKQVAEAPEDLIVYGGSGRAARNREALEKIIETLLDLSEDESLLVQSGKGVARFKTHPEAPRVLIANSNLVPKWATWDHFEELYQKGLMMYGQMTAGSWIYIGTQGILQGTYETFHAAAKKAFNKDLSGTLTVTGGLGGMGGAQPLAVTLNGGVCLAVDVDRKRVEKRIETRYLDEMTESFDEAVMLAKRAVEDKRPYSIGLVGEIGQTLDRLLEKGIIPDCATDQTSAHDPLNGYVPYGMQLEEALILRKKNPEEYVQKSFQGMARHVSALLKMKEKGAVVFDYGNNLRDGAVKGGEQNAYQIEGFVPKYIRDLFCEGQGPFRWAALSGDPEDIYVTDEALKEAFPEKEGMIRWLEKAREKVSFQGLPARICWLGLGEREKAGLIFNNLVKKGKVKAPLVIGRDHLDTGSVASPYRETEKMKDGSDAVSDWPILNLLSNCASGATWVSFHHGGGVGMGLSQHAGMVLLVDGTARAERCIKRVLHNDPAMGVIRHADAGYEIAKTCGEKAGVLL